MSGRAFWISLGASLAFHGAILTAFLPGFRAPFEREAVAVSLVAELPQLPALDRTTSRSAISPTEKDTLAPKQAANVSLSAAPEHRSAQAQKPAPPSILTRGSAELLADPQKGKVFIGYFGRIKNLINRVVRRKYSPDAVGHGAVSLFFVLDSDGSLDSVRVVEGASRADAPLRSFAVKCLKEAAPFGAFPKELGVNKISFNLTVLFEEI